MGHHINDQGQFQSDLHPELSPDKIILSFHDPNARTALHRLAFDYEADDPELSADIVARLKSLSQD